MTASSSRSIARWTGAVAISAASLAVALTSLAPGSFSYRSWPKPPGPGSVRSLVARAPAVKPRTTVVPDRVRVPAVHRVTVRPVSVAPTAPAVARPARHHIAPPAHRSPEPAAPAGGSGSGKPAPSKSADGTQQPGAPQTSPATPIVTRVKETVPSAPVPPSPYQVYRPTGDGDQGSGCPHGNMSSPADEQQGDNQQGG